MEKTEKKHGVFLLWGKATSPFPTEKRNVVYTLCGKRSGSKANQQMQKMVDSTTKAETCGGLYVSAANWQDAPTAPPVTQYG